MWFLIAIAIAFVIAVAVKAYDGGIDPTPVDMHGKWATDEKSRKAIAQPKEAEERKRS